MQTSQFELLDSSWGRLVPVMAYFAAGPASARRPLRLTLLSHGYGGHNTAYTFVALVLVARGYYVASLQHELPGDAPIPTTAGNVYPVRYPYWEQGVQTMRFAIWALLRRVSHLDTRPLLLLLGHFNGGKYTNEAFYGIIRTIYSS